MEGYRGSSDSSKAVAEYDRQKQLLSPLTPDTGYAWRQLHCYLDFLPKFPKGMKSLAVGSPMGPH